MLHFLIGLCTLDLALARQFECAGLVLLRACHGLRRVGSAAQLVSDMRGLMLILFCFLLLMLRHLSIQKSSFGFVRLAWLVCRSQLALRFFVLLGAALCFVVVVDCPFI